jgi:hypothetical protein
MRLRCLILVALISVPAFWTVSENRARADSSLRVATSRCDVTPPIDGHPLIWVVPVKEVEDPLLANGIVLDDGRSRYVLGAMDWCVLCNSSYDLFRMKIAAGAETTTSRRPLGPDGRVSTCSKV